MMRVLFVNPTTKVGGGAEVVLNNLVEMTRDSGYPCAVAAPGGGEYETKWRARGVPFFDLPLRSVAGKEDVRSFNFRFHLVIMLEYLRTAYLLLKIIYDFSPTVVYVNNFWIAFYVAPTAWLCRRPVIWHVHDLIRPTRFNRSAIWLLEKFVDTVIVISDAVYRAMVAANVSGNKLVTVHNGTDVSRFSSPSRSERERKRCHLGISNDDILILNIGRLIPRKGHVTLIEAFARLAEECKCAYLLILGSPYDHGTERYREQLMKRVQEHGLQDRVSFVGWQEDVESFLGAADVVVSASWAEPFGLIIIEGMAAMKPIVSTNGGGEKELVVHDETGILVPPKEPVAMAHALKRLIEEPELRERMGMAGRERVQAKFHLRQQGERIIQILSHEN